MAVSEAEARRVRKEMERDALELLRSNPDMLVRPNGAFGDQRRVADCDLSQLEYVARRNVERAVERMLRNKNATTEA